MVKEVWCNTVYTCMQMEMVSVEIILGMGEWDEGKFWKG
jgi:hypothetical protein